MDSQPGPTNWLDPWQEGWGGLKDETRAKYQAGPVPIFWHREFPENQVVLDYVAGLVISPKAARELDSVLNALHIQSIGLFGLFLQVVNLEIERTNSQRKHIPPGESLPRMVTGIAPIVASYFHAYSVSVCSYVFGIGMVCEKAKASGELVCGDIERARTYADGVLGPIKVYRDKIGGHPACFSDNKKDDVFDRHASALSGWFSFSHGYYWAPAFAVGPADAAHRGSQASGLTPWSLSLSHLDFNRRYWIRPGGEPNRVYWPPLSRHVAYVEMPFDGAPMPSDGLGIGLGRFEAAGNALTMFNIAGGIRAAGEGMSGVPS